MRTQSQSPNLKPADTLRVRYRVRFAKTGLLRWISHRDLARLWERIGRRVDLPFSMTEGFHPKPRIAFPSALPLGIQSLDEVVEIELGEDLSTDELLSRLQADEQPGLTIHHIEKLELGTAKAQLRAADYHVSYPDDMDDAERRKAASAISELKQQDTVTIERKGKPLVTHVETQIPQLELQENQIFVRLVVGEGASLRVHDVLDLLGLSDWPQRGANMIRARVFLRGEPEHS